MKLLYPRGVRGDGVIFQHFEVKYLQPYEIPSCVNISPKNII